MANPILKLGLPKGSLEDPTIDLFDRAGWKVRKHPRNYSPTSTIPRSRPASAACRKSPSTFRTACLISA